MNFSIDAGTYTLKYNSQSESNIILNGDTNYIIPIYQRPYSWSEKQVRKIIADIFVSFWGYNKQSTSEPMFIGTMQLSSKEAKQQKIIDGQQRITTFLILLKVLSIRYPNSNKLRDFDFDWLQTKVNNGKQQDNLNVLIGLSSFEKEADNDLNRYVTNARLINQIIEDQTSVTQEDGAEFDLSAFLIHLFSKVYFVVIITKASLSKTLKIFDTINTTGLDLGAGDIFKIRMYEYLNKEGNNEKVFYEISALYEKIDANNKLANKQVTDIGGILSIYQFYLIAKYNLPTVLYSYGTENFFDRLFETLFNINKWDHFKNNVENDKLVLDLGVINDLIEVRFEWENKWQPGDYGTVENASILKLWWWSRYGRFWKLIFIFLHKYKNDKNRFEKMYAFSNRLVKLFLLYSIYYQKSVTEIHTTFNSKLIGKIVNEDYESVMQFIDDKLKSQNEYWQKRFKKIISGDILYSAKVKNILCRLSALLEENYISTSKKDIIDV